ncbi:MAG: NADH-quinone oxidoreductase subunit I [Puniceicoccales bacterium]|nr:NADH-quinone oxidoreductase subunit I [Puniceicoccales bacterium]
MLGAGIIKGLRITARNLIGSYHDPNRLTTQQYPEEPARLPANYRNFPFLVLDAPSPDEEGTLRCIACKMCERECPPQCIRIEAARDENGKLQRRPKIFEIDISICMGCGICVEVCPEYSIEMDHHFEVVETERHQSLLLNLQRLSKPNAYFHQINPNKATASDKAIAEKKQKAAERFATTKAHTPKDSK